MDHRAKLLEILEDALKIEAIETAFCGLILHKEDDDENVKDLFLQAFRPYWTSVPPESRDQIFQEFVSFVHHQKNPRRVELSFKLLGSLVESSVVPARSVCEAVIKTEHLSFDKELTWCKTFQLLLKTLGGVDYKGCRDILSLIFQKFSELPTNPDSANTDRIQAAVKIVQYVLDRKACLLPAYFVINEIYKHYPDGGHTTPHWAIAKLLSDFVDSFRPLAHIVTVSGRPSLLPVIGHPGASGGVWKLDPNTLSFPVKGLLPYNKELFEPQNELLKYVIAQPYSRDNICSMLGLNKQQKQRCPALEDLLVALVVVAMEKSEENGANMDEADVQLLWQHLSSHLIFFALFQFASFPHIVLSLYSKLAGRGLKHGRDHLMWVLLQFISGSIQKNQLSDFKPVMKLFDLLYPEKEPLPIPDISVTDSVHSLAMACIWVHLAKKAQQDSVTLRSAVPAILHKQLDFIQQCSGSAAQFSLENYKIPLLCNAYSTNPESFTIPMAVLVEMCCGNGKSTTLLPGPSNTLASGPTVPCPLSLLDSLTVHAKMSLIHSIVTRIIKLAQSQTTLALAPAVVETYSRLLVYMEIESLGIKGFIGNLLPSVFKCHAWGILHTLLEMFSYRLHHIPPHYRVTLLSHLHSIATVPQTNQNQLHLCLESTALRLVSGLGSSEVYPQLSRILDPKGLVSGESEELNRALVLTIARAMHVTGADSSGNWCEGILKALIANTKHNWARHTLSCFPQALQQFYNQNPCEMESKQGLRARVEEENRRWKAMSTEQEIFAHYADPSAPNVFICILWKMLLETGRLSPVCHKVLERLGARALSTHIRVFADFLVYEFSTSGGGKHVNKCILHLNDLIWKYNVVTLDRLVLCLALRSHEGNEAQVCFFIIQLLLLKPTDFRARVNAFVRDNSPQHWLQTDWHQKHMAYHTAYPERFYFEGLLEGSAASPTVHYLPIYFGNVCLRFLPVFDIVIHRFLELPPVFKSLESLLDHLGSLYKFHDRPVTYLYNTLHYYEQRLREKATLKKKLVGAVIGAQKDCRPSGWCLTRGYLEYLTHNEEGMWVPDLSYYCTLVGRLVDTIAGKSPPPFPPCDWRFNEFPNPAAHALHVTCLELMALPVTGPQVGLALFDVIYRGSYPSQKMEIRAHVMSWINAVGLVLTALPESYWGVVYDKICDTLQNDLTNKEKYDHQISPMLGEDSGKPPQFPYSFLDFTSNVATHSETHADYVLAVAHALWHHASIGQLTVVPQFIRSRVKPLVSNETQFLYVCCLVGPFLQRFQQERTRCLQEIVVELYYLLEKVNRESQHMFHIDTICDFLFHIKYMFVGDLIKEEVQKVIPKLRQSLQVRLRFMIQTGKREDGT